MLRGEEAVRHNWAEQYFPGLLSLLVGLSFLAIVVLELLGVQVMPPTS
jgi:hypothetical protein